MVRYLEIFFRHRVVLLLPLLISVGLAGVFAVSQERVYEGSVRLWIDRNALGAPAPDNQYVSAAAEQAAVIQELIKTRAFDEKVGTRSPLREDLARRSTTGIVNKAIGVISRKKVQPLSGALLDDLVYTTLTTKTTVLPAGPQIVAILFDYPDPRVAALTAGAILDQFMDEVVSGHRAQVQASADFYAQQTAAAEADLAKADANVFDYLAAHPDLARPGAVPDGTLTQLQRQDDFVRQRYATLLQKSEQAQLDLAAVNASAPEGFRVIDPAQIPLLPVSRLKLYLAAGGAGLGVGLLILVFGLIAFALSDSSLRRPEEVEAALGLKLVGTIPEIAA